VSTVATVRLGFDVVRVLVRTRRPRPGGEAGFDHDAMRPVLDRLATDGLPALASDTSDLMGYLESISGADPDLLSNDEALAFWLNAYNACAIKLAVEAWERGEWTVLRVPGAFSRPELEVAGERLSLNAIEHGKARRFGDPRIHAALVCGSLSCPTLRPEPYSGADLDRVLETQMVAFMGHGGAVAGDAGQVLLSRIFRWYGADFVRPARMPALFPASASKTLEAVRAWLPENLAGHVDVGFQAYDWALACTVG